jgi:two-component system chemotaxis sensor kinase CheA
MNAFAGMEGLLNDFLPEASATVADLDAMLHDLERSPQNRDLLYDIYRGFHTVKGGASFLAAVELARLCDLGERVVDKLRNRNHAILPQAIDALFEATTEIREMLSAMARGVQPAAASADLVLALERSIAGDAGWAARSLQDDRSGGSDLRARGEPNWDRMYKSLTKTIVENARAGSNGKGAPDRTDGAISSAADGRRAEQAAGGSGASVGLGDGSGSSVVSRPEVGRVASVDPQDPTVRVLVELLDRHLGVLIAGLEQLRRDANHLIARYRHSA